jgi:tungstate transport system substrate-binding protein
MGNRPVPWRWIAIVVGLAGLLALAATACGGGKEIILSTTTSTQDSGLLDVLLPKFKEETGYKVKVIAVGSGEALAMADRGDADAVLAHAPSSEQALVDKGSVVNRQLVMHNDFVILGPAGDPVGIKGMKSATEALTKIADQKASFISRGDDSGTDKLEKSLWKKVNLTPTGQGWYEESGQGMGATLQIASQKGAYTISDRGTYLAQSANLSLEVLVEGDPVLLNVYHVMQVNPEQFSRVNAEGGKAFVDFMVSADTQKLIGDFGVEKFGQPLFIPDAGKAESELGLP